ncbi:hypothetical protein [Candidatus Harpocratesius sp.]
MKREIQFNETLLIFREYDFENDPSKIVKYLYDKMNSPEGIDILKKGNLLLKNKS